MSMQDKIQELTNSLLRLSSGFTLSDAVDSDAGVNDGMAATPLAVKTAYDKAVEALNNSTTITYWE